MAKLKAAAEKDRPTLADVARMAGVSTATVSRYLTAKEQVTPKRRAVVEAAITALNYIPHAAARALASNNSHLIGAIFPRLDSLLFADMYELFQKLLQQRGYTLIVLTSDYDLDTEHEQVRRLLANSVDALVLVGTRHQPRTISLLDSTDTPYLFMAGWDADQDISQIGFDNKMAAVQITDHLIGLGHRKIGMIAVAQASNERAAARIDGVRQTLAQAGLELSPENLFIGEFSFADGARGLRQIWAQPDPPSAIICGSDLLAAGAVLEAQRMGIRIPEQLSITGFDDIDLAAALFPALTTIHTPRRQVTVGVVEALLGVLERDEPIKAHCFETHLGVRDSTGPCRATR
jgi:LacI family transcriptional regulator